MSGAYLLDEFRFYAPRGAYPGFANWEICGPFLKMLRSQKMLELSLVDILRTREMRSSTTNEKNRL